MIKKIFLGAVISASLLVACNNNDSDENRGGEKDPATMQPPSEAIPDSTKIVGDSVIVPDTAVGNKGPVGGSDTLQRNKH